MKGKRKSFTAIEEEFIARSILLEETGSPRLARLLIMFAVVSVISFVVWSMFAHVDEVAIAAGKIIPVGDVPLIQHPEGGRVTAVLVADGQHVLQGEVLLRLDPAYASSRAAEAQGRIISLRARLERVRALLEARDCNFAAAGITDSSLIREHLRFFSEYQRTIDLENATLKSQIAQQMSDLKELAEKKKSLLSQKKLLSEEIKVREGLVKEGLNSKLQYLSLQRQLSDMEGSLAEFPSRRARISASIDETRTRLAQLGSNRSRDLLGEKEQLVIELAQLTESSRRDVQTVTDLEIRAPVSGIVSSLKVHTSGEVIMPGASIMQIVPQGGILIAEVQITSRDIGHVRIGQRCLAKFSAFDYSRYGGIGGAVTAISANSHSNSDGSLYYRGTIKLDKDYIGKKSGVSPILPGMSVTADIRTGGRTIFEYLLKPVFASSGEALRER